MEQVKYNSIYEQRHSIVCVLFTSQTSQSSISKTGILLHLLQLLHVQTQLDDTHTSHHSIKHTILPTHTTTYHTSITLLYYSKTIAHNTVPIRKSPQMGPHNKVAIKKSPQIGPHNTVPVRKSPQIGPHNTVPKRVPLKQDLTIQSPEGSPHREGLTVQSPLGSPQQEGLTLQSSHNSTSGWYLTWQVASSQAFSRARFTMVFCSVRPMQNSREMQYTRWEQRRLVLQHGLCLFMFIYVSLYVGLGFIVRC